MSKKITTLGGRFGLSNRLISKKNQHKSARVRAFVNENLENLRLKTAEQIAEMFGVWLAKNEAKAEKLAAAGSPVSHLLF